MSAGGLRYTLVVRHPETGAATALLAGEPVPAWASGLAQPDDLTPGAGDTDPDPDGPPPKGGRGSGVEAWTEYASTHDVEVTDDMTRDDIIAALDAADVPTE